jgi:hypothetical protein
MWVLHCTVEPSGGSCPSESQVWIEMSVQANPFALGLQGATDLSLAIIGLLAVAWIFAMLARAIRIDEGA